MIVRRSILSAVGILCFSITARAAPVTWEFTGQLTLVNDLDGSLEGVFSVGMPFSGQYTFESTTPDSSYIDPTFGRYEDAVTGISGILGEVPFFETPGLAGSISVFNDVSIAGFDGYGVSGVTEFLGARVRFTLSLGDTTGSVLLDDSLPLTPPDLSGFDSTLFILELEPDGDALFGEITSLVPEQGTLVLMVVSVFLLSGEKSDDNNQDRSGVLRCS